MRSLAAATAPLPGPPPTPPERQPQATPTPPAHPFAELLRQNRLAAAASSVATPKAPAPPEEEHAAPAQPSEASTPAAPEATLAQHDAAAAKGRPAAARGAPRPSVPGAASRSSEAPEHDRGAQNADANATAAQPPDATALAGAVAAARADAAPPGEVEGGDADLGAGTKAAATIEASRRLDAANAAGAPTLAGGSRPDRSAAAATPQRGAGRSLEAATQRSVGGDADPLHEPAVASLAEVLSAAKAAHEPRPSLPGDPAGAGASALAAPAAALTNVAPGSDATASVVTLATPVDASDFAAAFGAQVSVFVRDGVQHAELHLHPADMGPVSISITLDGTQARVDFGADLAATRQAIESGLPELASALSDAGFTLAGGGVAQHSRPGGGDAGEADSNRSRATGAASRGSVVDAPATRQSRQIAVGGVDVYA